ncbi:MAG: carbamoyl phosphate synthase small subunit [Candidatus Levybacteria bacterium RIFCSPHIGHO2_02_FULL_37_18]|nr:MAG: carbamoyl phosphate synthase small subunit [Candidatus Levybacteria bacterium RIFCSPHIGHO2_01_FULL_38_12]OGH22400.1 MAG: carbamoyl phosphate synthase small subunit [Candidatus Levybacteria bacterium RIFCSPHIGHO2_02_FULL_37_18]OGH34695.1 MAG: carbamoyl phosphate synthase small subunit [Candidatus Levybacteria bacterium RIFCSPLOWO2_01_FULL_37_20]OGH43453.1 MAG: carbamoyl phosphate synthase small subunit [Candidatus Levybacteria bacterium RIFCSPLOWO2_02_FULL_37_18]
MNAKLILENNSEFEGASFGAELSSAGEVVFSTGMVGYPESLTDPSYVGQILIFTYPIIGNYGVPDKQFWESDKIQTSGIIVSNYIDTPSHFQSKITLSQWLKKEGIPGLEIKDTRLLTQKIREKGTMLGKIIINKDIKLYDPNLENLVAKVSTKKITKHGSGKKTVLLYDCGAKANIARSLVKRGVHVVTVPWNFDPFQSELKSAGVIVYHPKGVSVNGFDGIVIPNGPGNPKMAKETIKIIKKALKKNIPILGVCLGHQLLALAAGGDTAKLKFGHRSQNQPCIQEGTKRCYITTQNHGFHVSKIPEGFKPWFTNANDGSNEGLIHEKLPIMSVQFHPEACPGPTDMEWIFDYFLEKVK